MAHWYDDLPYIEIWFNLYDGNSAPLMVRVQGPNNAREAWDRLSREFFMISARP
jgi:hypothetical protein